MTAIRHDWTRADIRALFELPFADLLHRAQTVHRAHFDPNAVQVSTLLSIKTGACPEDCGYCPQSAHHEADVNREALLDVDAVVAAARAALELAEQAKTLGPLVELEEKVAANPLDHQSRFDLALALNAKGKRAEAVNHLIEIVRRDRKWNDDGARKQLVQFFEAWGATDEATVDGRKRLSSVLFS